MIIALKEISEHFPISYTTAFRMSRDMDSPFFPCFLSVGGKVAVDLEKFRAVAEKQNEKRALERRGI